MTQWGFSASVLILIVLVLRAAFRGKIVPWLQYALWGLVLLRLLVPFALGQSRVSVANVLPTTIQSVGRDQRVPPEAPKPTEAVSYKGEVPTGGTHGARPTTAQYHHPVQSRSAAAAHAGAALRGVWGAGIALVLLAILGSNLSFYLKLRRSRTRMEFGLPLTVYTVEALPSPCLFGLFRPAVYVPSAYVWDAQAMDHILAHECAHYRQGDHIWSLLRSLCVAVHWFNPLVWLAAVLSKRDAELACDAKAIASLGEDQRLSYGRTLLTLITAKPRPADFLSCATTMTSGKRSLQARIKAIAKKPKMLAITCFAVSLVVIIAVGCTFTGPRSSDIAAIEADQADLRLYGAEDVQYALTGDDAALLLALYNGQELEKNSQPVGMGGRITVVFRKDGETVAEWTVTPAVCAAEGVGNYRWTNDAYDQVWDLYWQAAGPVDGGTVVDPLSSVWTPALTQKQIPQVLDLYSAMELTATSNEPDLVSQLYVSLNSGDRTLLHFFMDKKGEVTLFEGETPHYYMCENGEDVYTQLDAMRKHLQYLGEHASSYYTPPKEEQAAADFYAAMTFDQSRDYFILPEGDYDGWSFRLDGRKRMDGGNDMSFHQEIAYGDSLVNNVHTWSFVMNAFSELYMTVVIPSDVGGTPYVSDVFDLKALADQATQPPRALLAAFSPDLEEYSLSQISCVMEGDMVYGPVPLSDDLAAFQDLLSDYDWTPCDKDEDAIATSQGSGGFAVTLSTEQADGPRVTFYSHGDLAALSYGDDVQYYRAEPRDHGIHLGDEFIFSFLRAYDSPEPIVLSDGTLFFGDQLIREIYSEDGVYSDDRGKPWEYSYHVPQLNFDSDDAKAINAAIDEAFSARIEEDLENIKNGYSTWLSAVSWHTHWTGSILTLVIQADTHIDDTTYQVFHYDTATASAVSNADYLAAYGITPDQFVAALRTTVEEWLNETEQNFDWDWPTLPEDTRDHWEERKAWTLTEENVHSDAMVYEENGRFYVIVPIGSIAGASYYYHVLPLDI